MMLVSLAEAQSWLRIDAGTVSDARLTALIEAASAAVMAFLKDLGAEDFTDSNYLPIEDSNGVAQDVPSDVKAATMVMTGYLDRGPDGDPDHAFKPGELPPAVSVHVWHRRDPTLA